MHVPRWTGCESPLIVHVYWSHLPTLALASSVCVLLPACLLPAPTYHSKLFLDCCGLVRRALRDLKDEFSFTIGPGNQAYQVVRRGAAVGVCVASLVCSHACSLTHSR